MGRHCQGQSQQAKNQTKCQQRGLMPRVLALRQHQLIFWVLLLSSFIGGVAPVVAEPEPAAGNVVLLHGLARTAGSMASLEKQLSEAGYTVCNIDYPSRQHRVEALAKVFVLTEIKKCFVDPLVRINFVTHSLGGI